MSRTTELSPRPPPRVQRDRQGHGALMTEVRCRATTPSHVVIGASGMVKAINHLCANPMAHREAHRCACGEIWT
jgi:hypothetical protein